MENNRTLGWTTPEEAKRLVEAGLDPNTADMGYELETQSPRATSFTQLEKYFKALYVSPIYEPMTKAYPCWSLGVLISVMPKNIDKYNLCITFEKGCPMVYYIDVNGSILKLGDTYPYYRTDGYIVCDSIVEMCVWLLENGYIEKHE